MENNTFRKYVDERMDKINAAMSKSVFRSSFSKMKREKHEEKAFVKYSKTEIYSFNALTLPYDVMSVFANIACERFVHMHEGGEHITLHSCCYATAEDGKVKMKMMFFEKREQEGGAQ